MSVKIRLARHGRKQHAYYHIVVANSRAPRDGRFIERIGSYNPNTNPATIDLDFDKALDWLFKGAQPTDTTRSILSHQGVMMKKHLLEGAKKGAFSEADAEVKFEAWMKEKSTKIQASKEKLTSSQVEEKKARFKAEAKVNEARLAEIAKRNAAAAAAKLPAPAPITAPVEEKEVVVEAVAEEEVVEAIAEPVAEEAAPETKVETAEENTEA
ncbi:MAG: 30S ribosomal protein S16 [Bacteroidia bacterium]|nr:30S ribosomal protein S16 [Bacteroidia bacterium]